MYKLKEIRKSIWKVIYQVEKKEGEISNHQISALKG